MRNFKVLFILFMAAEIAKYLIKTSLKRADGLCSAIYYKFTVSLSSTNGVGLC